ncbi:hypothetical protein DXG03_008842 [Asterophora parasitica]|uniref:Fungal-type protein kinase domain-containing protein n=1 Tax=Asterophora parasitica TaxID=117018 RepID=A0A9P7FKI6_9AGAR|nr:hypothetical protein DXG03_008842 [Asterophora parasitica]
MAVELMVPNPPAHLYRHDLESFFYILIWAALHYDFKNKTHASRVHPAVEEWNNSKMKSAHGDKKALLGHMKADIEERGSLSRSSWVRLGALYEQ